MRESRALLAGTLLTITLLAGTVSAAGPARAADAVTGVWGVVRDGTSKCTGTYVHAFRDGRYFLVLPDLGSLTGVAHYVVDHAWYEIERGVVSVGPGLSMVPRIEPRRYRLARGRPASLVPTDDESVRYQPCRGFVFEPPAG
jgi:hypothetical protein